MAGGRGTGCGLLRTLPARAARCRCRCRRSGPVVFGRRYQISAVASRLARSPSPTSSPTFVEQYLMFAGLISPLRNPVSQTLHCITLHSPSSCSFSRTHALALSTSSSGGALGGHGAGSADANCRAPGPGGELTSAKYNSFISSSLFLLPYFFFFLISSSSSLFLLVLFLLFFLFLLVRPFCLTQAVAAEQRGDNPAEVWQRYSQGQSSMLLLLSSRSTCFHFVLASFLSSFFLPSSFFPPLFCQRSTS